MVDDFWYFVYWLSGGGFLNFSDIGLCGVWIGNVFYSGVLCGGIMSCYVGKKKNVSILFWVLICIVGMGFDCYLCVCWYDCLIKL